MTEGEELTSSLEGDKGRGTKRNFAIISLACFCAFTSLNAVTSLQSSINTNGNVGLNSLAIMFGASLVTAVFFTTPIEYIFG